tara:strand:+ start:266 stop:508 length:243 start_codon:yes stop_codon:yes gene_type:complete
LQKIHRLQLNLYRISQPNHVASIDSSKCKLGVAENIDVIFQQRNMNKPFNQSLIKSNMESLISYRGDEAREPLTNSVPQP